MIDASPCYFRTYVTEQGRFLRPNSNFGRQNPLLSHFLSMQDFSLTFIADLKHITMVFSEILPLNLLNSDADLSVQRKPFFGSSLFRIVSFDTTRRNWYSLCSLETIFNRGNFDCYYYWMFLIFSGCFQQRYTNCSVTSQHFESFVFFMGYTFQPLLMGCLIQCFPHLEIHFGCHADEAQSFCFCFMIRQYCKMETKVNWESPTCLFPKVQPA